RSILSHQKSLSGAVHFRGQRACCCKLKANASKRLCGLGKTGWQPYSRRANDPDSIPYALHGAPLNSARKRLAAIILVLGKSHDSDVNSLEAKAIEGFRP